MTMTVTTTTSYATLVDDYRNDPLRLRLGREQCADVIQRAGAVGSISDDDALKIAAVMNVSTAVRDALIVSAVSAPDYATILMLATDPQEPTARKYMFVNINRAFRDATYAPDPWRVSNLCDLCEQAERLSPDQPATHEARAWLSWLMGEEAKAKREAIRALRIDDQRTLPKIIIAAILQGVRPEYLK